MNHHLGDASPPRDLSFCACFWVLDEELPGGVSLTARRHMYVNPVVGFLVGGLGGDEHPSGVASRIDSILMFCVF